MSGDKWDLKSRQKFEVYENQFVYDEEDDDSTDDVEEDVDVDEEDVDEEEVDDEYEEEYGDGEEDL